MKTNRFLIVLLMLPLAGLALPAALWVWKKPVVRLTSAEKDLINFNYQPITITRSEKRSLPDINESPVTAAVPAIPAKQALSSARKLSLKAAAAPIAHEPLKVSMIYHDGSSRMAIINGMVVREGTELGIYRVVKIENPRVLLKKAGKDLWIRLD